MYSYVFAGRKLQSAGFQVRPQATGLGSTDAGIDHNILVRLGELAVRIDVEGFGSHRNEPVCRVLLNHAHRFAQVDDVLGHTLRVGPLANVTVTGLDVPWRLIGARQMQFWRGHARELFQIVLPNGLGIEPIVQ